MPNTLENYQATIIGLACGDALGAPTEFMRIASIKQRWGPSGISDLSQTDGRFTDDTQMTIALAEGLLDVGPEAPLPALMQAIAKRFVEWSRSPENNRAPGTTCMGGCRNLERGVPWDKAGIEGSKGCGAVMRVAPIGLLYKESSTITDVARASARLTHGHPVAAQSAHMGALAVRLLLDGLASTDLVPALLTAIEYDGGINACFAELLSRVELAVRETMLGTWKPYEIMVDEDTHQLALGEAWKADSALACALYCFLLAFKRGEGFVETVRYGANSDGDADSIACIAGGFAGALWGMGGERGVPPEWYARVEDAGKLCDLANRIYAVSPDATTR